MAWGRIAILILAASAALAFLALLALRPGVDGQVNATFSRLQEATAAESPAQVLAELSPSYDFLAQWPALQELTDGMLGPATDAQAARERGRMLVSRLLTSYFQQHKGQDRSFTFSVQSAEGGGDEATAVVDLEVTEHGKPIGVRLAGVTFTFERKGWLRPRLLIASHKTLDDRTLR